MHLFIGFLFGVMLVHNKCVYAHSLALMIVVSLYGVMKIYNNCRNRSFFLQLETWSSFDSMIFLASLLVPSSGFTSCLCVEFTSYSTSESTITYFLSPMGPSSLLRDTSCNVIFFSFTKVSQTFFPH
jgi:hypothetical protein